MLDVQGPWSHLQLNCLHLYNYQIIFSRLYLITTHIVVALFKYPIWILILLSFIFMCFNKKYFKDFSFIIIFLFLNIFFIYGVYFVTKSPLEWHLAVSLDRLMFQGSGFYIVLLTGLMENKKIFL